MIFLKVFKNRVKFNKTGHVILFKLFTHLSFNMQYQIDAINHLFFEF